MIPQRRSRLSELTYSEAESLRGAIALLPCGAIEAHGPHLPLDTDVLIAQSAAEAACSRLEAEDWSAIVLPPLAYAVADYASEFPGTLSIPAEVVTALVREVCAAAARSGFVGVVLCNVHLDPAHLAALSAGVSQARERGVDVAFPDITRKPYAVRLGDEFRSGACHAGRFETSLVLASDPFVVRDCGASLPPNPISLSRAIREGKRTFREAGGMYAYFGDPASASAAEGTHLLRELADIFATAAVEILEGGRTRGLTPAAT